MRTKTHGKIAFILSSIIFAGFFGWWLFNYFAGEPGDRSHELFSDTYWALPLMGSFIGILVAKQWGGLRSVFGRALLILSAGLLAQVFGQITYSYFALVKGIEAPYPSIGDVGFFGSVILYIAAILLLSKVIGATFRRANTLGKVTAVAIPVVLLTASYAVFLKGYDASETTLLTKLLDFGYPLGQALYVSLAILALILSRKYLGGTMRNKIIILLAAFLVQYSADYSFLYRFSHEQWYPGDFSDLLYLVSYFLMISALVSFGKVARGVAKA